MSRDDNFLSRWSRLKHEAAATRTAAPAAEAAAPAPDTGIRGQAPSGAQSTVPAAPQPAPPEPQPLPPIESLTSQSDFTAFMKPEVDPLLRRQALKTLFSDPRFNVMDGLDVYIDDYTKADPLPEGWLEKMSQVARLGAYEPPREEPEKAAVAPEAATPAVPAATTHEEPPAPEEGVPPSGTADHS